MNADYQAYREECEKRGVFVLNFSNWTASMKYYAKKNGGEIHALSLATGTVRLKADMLAEEAKASA